jgi:hypothetical protein
MAFMSALSFLRVPPFVCDAVALVDQSALAIYNSDNVPVAASTDDSHSMPSSRTCVVSVYYCFNTLL